MHNSLHILGVPEGEESEEGIKDLFEEIMAKNFPSLMKEKVTEAQRIPIKMNPKRPTPRYIIIEIAKVKDKEGIL